MSFKYEFKYVGNRHPHINNIDPVEIDDCFKTLQEQFGLNWLDENSGNIIQSLWHVPYHLATVELYSLGNAIRRLLTVDPNFVKARIEGIKGNDIKTQNGALFEIFALNSFASKHNVQPAKENNPGYDGTVLLSKEKSFRLSIKNYAISVHHNTFLKEAEMLKDTIEKLLASYDCPPLEIIVTAKGGYPSSYDWQRLKDHIGSIFDQAKLINGKLATGQIDDWGLILHGLKSKEGIFSKAPKSYTLIISSPFHKNEEKNLHDKLEEACANLIAHANNETEDIKNFVMIHLPRIASRKNCEQWAKDYFAYYPEKPISAILLYQPLVMKDEAKDVNYISNGLSIVVRDTLLKDFGADIINLAFPVGRLENNFGNHVIYIQDRPDSAIKIELTDCYVYQHGNHYFDAQPSAGGLQGNLNKVASGVFTHSVLKIGSESMVLSGQFEPVDELAIM